MSLYMCGSKTRYADGISRVAAHNSCEEAQECAVLHIAIRNEKNMTGEEVSLLLHPEIREM